MQIGRCITIFMLLILCISLLGCSPTARADANSENTIFTELNESITETTPGTTVPENTEAKAVANTEIQDITATESVAATASAPSTIATEIQETLPFETETQETTVTPDESTEPTHTEENEGARENEFAIG